MSVEATDAEKAAVDGLIGTPDSTWNGDWERMALDGHVAFGGYHQSAANRHLLLPALHAVQDAVGWISKGALNYICERLIVPPAEAYGVASFYALLSLEPRPARVAHVCDDVCCRDRGGLEILSALQDRPDVMPSPCLGQCDRGPAVFVQRAGEPNVVLTRATVEGVVAALDTGFVSEASIETRQSGDALRLMHRIGVIDPTSLDAYRQSGGYVALAKAIEMGGTAVIEEVKASNLRGRGGAAFPMGVKWEGVVNSTVQTRYLICNADESEPGTFKDRVLLEGDPFALVESMTIAAIATGVAKGYVYIRAEYPVGRQRIENAIGEAKAHGFLGSDVAGSGQAFDIEVRSGAGAYICGEETALMNSIEGHRGEPRNKPPFPTVSGLFGKPTIINNVETLMNLPEIINNGGAAFARIGTDQSTGPKLFCLAGAVANPGVYEVPFGTTLRALLDLAGGIEGELGAIMLGGAAGVFVGEELLDMPLTFEDARDRNVTLGSGVVMVFDTSTDFADVLRRIAEFFRDESCGQCVPCRVGTVRQEELLARHLGGADLDSGLLDEIATVMADASICGLGHTASGAIRSALEMGLV